MYSTFALLPPTLCFGTAPDQCFFFLVRPKSANTIDVEIGYLFHPTALDDPLFEQKLVLSDVGRSGVRATGPGRHRQGAARAAESVRAARALFVAGGEPRQLQPLARPALSGALAKQCAGRLRSLTSPHRRRRSGSNPSEQIQPVYGLTISPKRGPTHKGRSGMSKLTTTARSRRLVAGAAALVLVLAACGDDDDDADGAATAEADSRARGHRADRHRSAGDRGTIH